MKKLALSATLILLVAFLFSQRVSAGPVASLASADPSSGSPGDTLSMVTIYGKDTNFVNGVTTVDFGAGISSGTVTVINIEQLTVSNVVIDSSASTGIRTVIATTGAETASGDIFSVSSPDWVIQTSEAGASSSDQRYFYDVQFLSEKVGFMVGSHDTFGKTTDRGVTWNYSNISSGAHSEYHWTAVDAVDTNNIYVGGYHSDGMNYNPKIYKTSNGGSSWSEVFSGSASYTANTTLIRDIYFANVSRGWAAALDFWGSPPKHFFSTTNEGTSWTTVNISGEVNVAQISVVPTASNGDYDIWAVTNWDSPSMVFPPPTYYVLYKSTDAGDNWTPLLSNDDIGSGRSLSGVYFIDMNTGFWFGSYSPGPGVATGEVHKSTNGGSSWIEVSPSPKPASALTRGHFKDVGGQIHGWVVGGTAIINTTDGGSSWTSYHADPRTLRSVSYYNENNTWVAGGTGGYAGRVGAKYVVDPTISTLSPTQAAQGQTLDVTLTGTNFQGDPLSFGSGITVNSFDVPGESADTGTANITLASDAGGGSRDITLTNPDTGSGTKSSGFSVQTTTTTTTTTITTTTTTLPSGGPEIDSMSDPVQLLAAAGKTTSHIIAGDNFASGCTVKLVKSGQADIIAENVQVSIDGKQISFTVDLPPKTDTGAIGYWDIVVTNPDSSSATYAHGFSVELPEGEVFFYPTELSFRALRASAPNGQARIAYSLSENKAVDILIYDVRDMRIVFRRKYSSGQTGGALGYNEILWDGTTDFGGTIANGTYVLQIVSGGKVIGKTYFVVKD